MDDIFSKINHNDKERDEGGNPANNNGDSMQNDQKKPKGYKSSFKKHNLSTTISAAERLWVKRIIFLRWTS